MNKLDLSKFNLSKEQEEIIKLFVANEIIMQPYLQQALRIQNRGKNQLKDYLYPILVELKKQGRTAVSPLNRKEREDLVLILAWLLEELKEPLRSSVRNQIKPPYKVSHFIQAIVLEQALLNYSRYLVPINTGWTRIVSNTLEIDPKKREEIISTPWNDGRDTLDFRDRLNRNAVRMGLYLAFELVEEMVGNYRLTVLENTIDLRYAKQQGEIKRDVTTSTTHISNESIMEKYTLLGVDSWEHISVLDSRTTVLCRSRHGKIWKSNQLIAGVTIPPLHHRCRSVLAPVI